MFVRGLVVLVLLASSAIAGVDDNRTEWQYETQAGTRRIEDVGQGKWLLHFPNGASTDLKELNRTEEYVELSNLTNGNTQRLFSDRGMVQKQANGPFRRFADGQWVAIPAAKANDYRIRIVYFVPADRTPLPNYESRIRTVLSLMAEIMTTALREHGVQTDGPQFELNQNDEINVRLLRSEKKARDFNGLPARKSPDHPQSVFAEVDQMLGEPNKNLTFIFAETYETGPSQHTWPGHVAVAAARPPSGGIGVFSAWILRDEFCASDLAAYRRLFFDETPIPGRRAIGNKSLNSPRADFLEDGVGGALHELAHTFGLTHHGRGPSGKLHVMGQGFRNLRWNVGLKSNNRLKARFSRENAWMLMTSRYLNAKVDRTDSTRPHAEVALQNRGSSIDVTVVASDDRQLSLLTVVEVTKDDGRQLIQSKKLSGTMQTVNFKITPRDVSGANPQLQFLLVDAGGNHHKVTKSLAGN